tara:strand:- start:146 stop:1573 length:1428 start_codon:yes stop_codon:yes gene_type:complete
MLTEKISTLSSGGVYPLVIPQNAIGGTTKYPALVYNQYNEYESSKDSEPNMSYCQLSLQIISDSYKTMDEVGNQVRDLLDHYEDKSTEGLFSVPNYTDNGYVHNFINNIDIQNIFYTDQEDEYYEKLNLFTRRIEYDIYYYDNIGKFSYNQKNSDNYTPTNPLALYYDFTAKGLMRKSSGAAINYHTKITNNTDVDYVFNKLGIVKDLSYNTITTTNDTFYEYLQSGRSQAGFRPTYKDGLTASTLPFLEFSNYDSLEVVSSTSALPSQFVLPFGAMIIYVYKPIGTGSENYLLGSKSETEDLRPLILSHKKVGDDITLHFKPNGITFDDSSSERTLISSTDSTNYWDADYHFFCLSLGGSKQYTGGSYNQVGWYEYFNSNYNPKLTTGQILKNNLITGNTDNLDNDTNNNFYLSRIGQRSGDATGEFRVYELLLFIPNEAQTHNIDADAAPFQPTDIIYKKVKDYIYNKYELLK